jgi:hypothetical protein
LFCKNNDKPGNAGGAAHFISVGVNNDESTAANEESEAMGEEFAFRINDNINCQWGPFFGSSPDTNFVSRSRHDSAVPDPARPGNVAVTDDPAV